MFISTELRQTLYAFVLYREEPGKLEEIVVLRELQTQFTIQQYSVSQEPEAPTSSCWVFIFKSILLLAKSCLYLFLHHLLNGRTQSLAEV